MYIFIQTETLKLLGHPLQALLTRPTGAVIFITTMYHIYLSEKSINHRRNTRVRHRSKEAQRCLSEGTMERSAFPHWEGQVI